MSYKFSKKTLLEAIKDSNGIMLRIAKRLKTTSRTAKKYVELWPETREAIQEETENVLDIAESKLIDEIKSGELSCIKWYLSKKGKARGYGDEIESVSGNETPPNIQIILDPENSEPTVKDFYGDCN